MNSILHVLKRYDVTKRCFYVTGGDADRFEARCEEVAGTSEQQTELHK